MIKKTLKRSGRKSLSATKKIVVKVPFAHKAALKIKRAITAELAADRETYNYHAYYPSIQEHMGQLSQASEFKHKPLISLLLPTYNTPEDYLRECLDSVVVQSYEGWELCIADDASPDPRVVKVLKEYAKKDKRIRWVKRESNGHISRASNSALELATGEYIALLDHDDVLWPNALYEIVKAINANPKAELIYSDEDKIDGTGIVHSYPFLKPDFSPEFLESCNYITHFTCIKTELINSIGGFRTGCEGAQDWDLFIRATEKTKEIVHIPKLLYSWRIHEASTASNTDAKPYVYEAQKKLLDDHLKRTKRDGQVETGIIRQHRTIKYKPKAGKTAVIVFFHDLKSTKKVAASLSAHSAGLRYKLVYITNDILDDSSKQSITELYPDSKIEFILQEDDEVQNKYIAGAKRIDADQIIFIEDGTEVLSNDWAKVLVADSQTEGVGAVGPVLLGADKNTVMSAGVGLGYGPNGAIDMLSGISFEDPHYTRGLYVKSRRNVGAVNATVFAIRKDVLLTLDNFSTVTEMCYLLLIKSYRHVYTPYARVAINKLSEASSTELPESFEDPYLNPNFNKENQYMEVKA